MTKYLSILFLLLLSACASVVLDPVTLAVHNGDLAALRHEIEVNGASPNSRDFENKPIMLRAAWKGHQGIVDYLIARGVDVNAGNAYNQQPLHIATTHGHLGIVKSLVSAGADLNAVKSDTKSTPLLLAGLNNRHDIAMFLVQQGAGLQYKDYKNYDILAYAHKNNDSQLADLVSHKIRKIQIAERNRLQAIKKREAAKQAEKRKAAQQSEKNKVAAKSGKKPGKTTASQEKPTAKKPTGKKPATIIPPQEEQKEKTKEKPKPFKI